MKTCAISGKQAMAGRNIRHKHSGGWALRAPRSLKTFEVNLQTVRVPVEGGGTAKIRVAARMISSEKFKKILTGQTPMTKAAIKAATTGNKKNQK